MIQLECFYCGANFTRSYRISAKRKRRPQFCSRVCVAADKSSRKHNVEKRFWQKVQVLNADECWPWSGRLDPNGYGRLDVDGRPQLAHRIAYAISNRAGEDPETVCHSCDNPKCCNPRHLWAGTQLDNIADMHRKGRAKRPTVRRGTQAINAKLDAEKAIEAITSTMSNSQLAKRWGVTSTAVYNIRAGLSWSHVTGLKRDA